jgi:hypothetical protein
VPRQYRRCYRHKHQNNPENRLIASAKKKSVVTVSTTHESMTVKQTMVSLSRSMVESYGFRKLIQKTASEKKVSMRTKQKVHKGQWRVR